MSNKTLFFVVLILAFLAVVYCQDAKVQPKTETKVEEKKEGTTPNGEEVTEDEEDETPGKWISKSHILAKVYTNVADVLKDVKENKLKDLFVRNVKISEEEAKTIAEEITSNQSLDRFVLTKNEDLSVAALKTIVSAFAKNQKLRVIGFTKNKIGDEGAAAIAEGIKEHQGLQKFYLYHSDVSGKGIEPIVKSLSTLKSLTKVVVIENKIGDEGAKLFAEFLKGSKLTEIILRDIDMKAEGYKAVAQAVKETKTLLKIDLSENPIDLDGVKGLVEGISGNDHLTHIELAFNNIDGQGAKLLAEALTNNKVLKRVDLSENKVGNDGAKEFATFIEKDTPLEKLDLSNNKITSEGAKSVLEALLKNKNFKRLFFYRNDVDDSIKELFTKAGDRIKSEYSDEIKFNSEDSTDDVEEPTEGDETTTDGEEVDETTEEDGEKKPTETKPTDKKPTETTPPKDEL